MGRLRIYDLGGLRICDLNNRGSSVRSLRVGYILASKVSSKATWVYRTNLVKWVRYKARDPIEFKAGKESAGSNVV